MLLVATSWAGVRLAAPQTAAPSSQDEFHSDDGSSRYPPGSYWDGISTEHPSCAGLVATHFEMTEQLKALDKKAKSTLWPEQREVVEELNALARERGAVARQINACVRESSRVRGAERRADKERQQSDRKRPPLQGGVQHTDVEDEVKEEGPPLRPGVPTPGIPPLPGRVEGGGPPSLPGGVSDDGPPSPPGSGEPLPDPPGDPTHPPGQQPSPRNEDPPERQAPSRRIFNYYYINGINTPLEGSGRGNSAWDRRLIAGNLLDKGERVGQAPQRGSGYETRIRVGDEIDVLAPVTHNPSGKDPSLSAWLSGFCAWSSHATRGVTARLASDLCVTAKWLDAVRAGGLAGQAGGDVIECARQALETFPGSTGIGYSANTDVVKQVTRLMLDAYAAEEQRQETNYFIVIAHSQGNFLGEGVAFRLLSELDSDRAGAKEIFEHRLGILSLASPTSYDSLPQGFRERRIQHFTRADDAIVALRALGGPAKTPWPPGDDLPALWPWQPQNLQAALRISGTGGSSPFLEAMSIEPPPACRCPQPDGALYIPLMNSHLLENYLADPPLTEPGRTMDPRAASLVGLSQAVSPRTPRTTPVLARIRFGLFQLKQELLGPR